MYFVAEFNIYVSCQRGCCNHRHHHFRVDKMSGRMSLNRSLDRFVAVVAVVAVRISVNLSSIPIHFSHNPFPLKCICATVKLCMDFRNVGAYV